MPPYRKRPYYFNYYHRRRRWRFPRRRTRKAFRRRSYRRKRHRRYRKVKRKRFFKKLKVTVRQFQPSSIKKCKIVGTKCLIQGSPLRAHNNYIQYVYSTVPPHFPGGGGWSLIVFKLESLYEDFQHLENVWTVSNIGLPLVRYLGCQFKFYQSEETDYVVIFDRCWPMIDTPLTHADSAPSRVLSRKHHIVIPSRKTQKNKKPYKKVNIKPPTQMQTHWYFSRDICKTPLVMLTTTAVSLTNPFCDPTAKNNNISLYVLNDKLFQKPNFQNFPLTSGYSPKDLFDEHHELVPFYIYSTTATTLPHEINKTTIKQLTNLTPLTNTLNNQAGTPINESNWEDSKKNWGNPFYHDNLDEDSVTWILSDMLTLEAKELMKTNAQSTSKFNLVQASGKPYLEVRYNPSKDTGAKNKAYLVNTSSSTSFKEPDNKNLIIEGLPLYIMLWGWTDFIKKIQETVDVDQNYLLVIQTDQFNTKDVNYFILIDEDFIQGYDPYTEHKDDHNRPPMNTYNKDHWFPKLLFQAQSINKICMSGPACPRMPYNHYMQAYCKYKFWFKWGGCPKKIPEISDPCLQSKWPTPDNILGRLEISNPKNHPENEVYSFDWDKDYLTKDFIERINEYTTINETTLPLSESKSSAKAIQVLQKETPQEKETEEKLFQQLQQLREFKLRLQLRLQQQLATKL